MNSPKETLQHFDGLTLAAVVAELNTLGEARIDKVGQASPHVFYLNLRAGRNNHRLLVNLNGPFARLHLTTRSFANLPVPTGFTMQLRKHMEGSRLLRVEQNDLERAVKLVIAGRDELGDPFERWLIIELIGKYANMFLVESQTGTLLGCLRAISEDMCGVRQLATGLPYDPPPVPQNKTSFLRASAETFAHALSDSGSVLDALMNATSGLSKTSAQQLLESLELNPGQSCASLRHPDECLKGLVRAQQSIRQAHFNPRPVSPTRYSVWGVSGESAQQHPSVVLDSYYAEREIAATLHTRRHQLRQLIQERIGRQHERLKSWEKLRQQGTDAEQWKRRGDLLSAHLHQVQPRAHHIRVVDYFDPEQPEVELTLAPELTPSENVQRLYRRYRKAKNGLVVARELLQQGEFELAYLHSIQSAIELATEPDDLEEIFQELIPNKEPSTGRRRPPISRAPRPLRVSGPAGCTFLIGKNNRQNDHVTFKEAHSNDWWLHTRDHPGAHVVIRADVPIGHEQLEEAALLAAWFSPARNSAQVAVVYTRKKYVKKIPGGRPGLVIYEQEKTLFVTPEEAQVRALLASANLRGDDDTPRS
jgi:predicted ribosome quality control (RQC) complex YloA/Tae2 family protein